MLTAPKVSVVIDNHNYGRFLKEALDSVLAQGPGKLEAVIEAFEDSEVVCVQHFPHDTDSRLVALPRRFSAWPAHYEFDDYVAGRTEFTATSGLSFRRETLQKLLPIPKDLFYYLDDFLSARAIPRQARLRAVTIALAVLSPTLYLALYDCYSRRP